MSGAPLSGNLTSEHGNLTSEHGNLTSECWRSVEKQLLCHVHTQPDNSSRRVCQLKPGEDGDDPESMYAIFLSVIVSNTFLAITLNVMVILVIALNRRLHTLVNYLTCLLCANNVIWAVFPIVESVNIDVISTLNCSIRHYVLQITRSVNFGVIVTITLLRYLLVVRNHSYPVARNNMLLFTAISVLPCTIRLVLQEQDDYVTCGSFFAWTPDDWPINSLAKRETHLETLIGLLLEYLIGFCILTFCFVNILMKSVASRRQLKKHSKSSRSATAPEPLKPPSPADTPRPPTPRRHSSAETDENIPMSTKLSVPVDISRCSRRRNSFGVAAGSTNSAFADQENTFQSLGTQTPPAPETERSEEGQSATSGTTSAGDQSGGPDLAAPSIPDLAKTTSLPMQVTDLDEEAGSSAHDTGCLDAIVPAPDPLNDGVILSPSALKTVGSPVLPAPVTARTTSTGQRPLNVPKITLTRAPQMGRVDIVATIAMIAFLSTFFISFAPYVALVYYEKGLSTQCVIMPGARMVIMSIVIISGGITATLNPLVCVVFSRDFRQAFRQTRSQFWDYLSR